MELQRDDVALPCRRETVCSGRVEQGSVNRSNAREPSSSRRVLAEGLSVRSWLCPLRDGGSTGRCLASLPCGVRRIRAGSRPGRKQHASRAASRQGSGLALREPVMGRHSRPQALLRRSVAQPRLSSGTGEAGERGTQACPNRRRAPGLPLGSPGGAGLARPRAASKPHPPPQPTPRARPGAADKTGYSKA